MKKGILTLVGLGMIVTQLMAYTYTEATFSASEDRMIRVIMDGRVMNWVPKRHVQLRDIRPGDHNVQLQVFGRHGRRALVNDQIYLRRGYKSKFRIQRYRRNRLKLYRAGVQPLHYRDSNYRDYGYGKNKGYRHGKKGNGHGKTKGNGDVRYNDHRSGGHNDHYESCGIENDHHHRRNGDYDDHHRRKDYRYDD